MIREETGTAIDREPDNVYLLYWPWATDGDHATRIEAAWHTRMSNVRHFATFHAPYICLWTEDLFLGDDCTLDMAHQCQALRAALESHGYHDPEEVAGS